MPSLWVSVFAPIRLPAFLFPEPQNPKFDYSSQTLVIIGAGTNTGRLAVQFAHLMGIGTIIAVASLSGAEVLKRYGATYVIVRQGEDVNGEVRKIVGDGALYVLDTFNHDSSLAVSILSNSKCGTLVHLTSGKVTPSDGLDADKVNGALDDLKGWSKNKWVIKL